MKRSREKDYVVSKVHAEALLAVILKHGPRAEHAEKLAAVMMDASSLDHATAILDLVLSPPKVVVSGVSSRGITIPAGGYIFLDLGWLTHTRQTIDNARVLCDYGEICSAVSDNDSDFFHTCFVPARYGAPFYVKVIGPGTFAVMRDDDVVGEAATDGAVALVPLALASCVDLDIGERGVPVALQEDTRVEGEQRSSSWHIGPYRVDFFSNQ